MQRFKNQFLLSFIITKLLNIYPVASVLRIKWHYTFKMHILQPKHTKLNEKEVQELLKKYNVSKSQLPKILLNDAALADMNCAVGDIIKIERKEEDKINLYFRVVV